MKIYIMTDMEGVSGISRQEQVLPGTSSYESARHLLCSDVNAAIAGAFDGGASEVLVSDGHGTGFNFVLPAMDSRAVYERPNGPADYLAGLDETFSGVFCIGYHAMAGTLNGFLDHTQSSREWFDFFVNGRRTGELGQVGILAGSYGVPVVLCTGDRAACDEAKEFFGDIETVSVKQGIGRESARCVHPEVARDSIREAAKRAMSHCGRLKPTPVEGPLTVRLVFQRTELADAAARRVGTLRVDARTVERVVHDPRQLLNI